MYFTGICLEELKETSIDGAAAKIRIDYFPNRTLEGYRYTSALGLFFCN
jgi:hypothetical protein